MCHARAAATYSNAITIVGTSTFSQLVNYSGDDIFIYICDDGEAHAVEYLNHVAYELSKIGISEYYIDKSLLSTLRSNKVNNFIADNIKRISYIYDRLADESSKENFLRAVKAKDTGDAGYYAVSPYKQYRHPLVDAYTGDSVCEGGLFTGRSTLLFARRTGPTGKIIGFEPEARSAALSKETCATVSSYTRIEQLGLWSEASTFKISYDEKGGAALRGAASAEGELCRATDLDSYLNAHNARCDLLKLDIEGAEIPCLFGARETIRRYRPKLQISIYHKPYDLLDIPEMLMKLDVPYRFYLGHHSVSYLETVLYATVDDESVAVDCIGRSERNAYEAMQAQQESMDALAKEKARALEGKEMLFFGAGKALEHFMPFFDNCPGKKVVVDSCYFSNMTREHIKENTIIDYATLSESQKKLPLIVCVRDEYAHRLVERLKMHHPHLFVCLLYSKPAYIGA